MSAIFTYPLPLVVDSANSTSLSPAANLNVDMPSLMWQSASLSTVFVTVGVAAGWDTIALVGSNLRAGDTIRIRCANTSGGTTSAPLYDVTIPAWAGTKPSRFSALSVLKLAAPVAYPSVRLDISAPGHPDGFVRAQRLVVGQSITTAGIDQGSEMSIDANANPGYARDDEQEPLKSWKIKLSRVDDASYRSEWVDLLSRAGVENRAILVVPVLDDPSRLQVEGLFGAIVAKPLAARLSSKYTSMELSVRALAA